MGVYLSFLTSVFVRQSKDIGLNPGLNGVLDCYRGPELAGKVFAVFDDQEFISDNFNQNIRALMRRLVRLR